MSEDLFNLDEEPLSPEESLKRKIEFVKNMLIIVRNSAKEADLLNTQTYIDFEDFLNKMSTMDPNDNLCLSEAPL